MTYNSKNYTEQGGEKTVIGGTLEIKDEATVVGLSLIENQTESSATTIEDLVTDFNALLSKLKTAGVMAEDRP